MTAVARRAPLPPATVGVVLSITPDGVEEYRYDIDTAKRAFAVMLDAYKATSEFGKIARTAKHKKPRKGKVAGEVRSEEPPTGHSAPLNLAASPAQQLATMPVTPDEGGAADPDAVAVLRSQYNALPPDARAWLATLSKSAAQAGVAYYLNERHTVRRFEIVRALVTAATYDLDHGDDIVRCAAATVLGDCAHFPAVTVGHVAGALDATGAVKFAELVDRLVGGLPVAVGEGEG